MATFNLICTLSTEAFTTVEAESLEEAIDLSLDREVWMEEGDPNVVWVGDSIHNDGPSAYRMRQVNQNRTPIEMPAMHVDGTGADRMFEGYTNVVSSIRDALRDIPKPNAQDYPSAGAFDSAMLDYRRRVAALWEVLADLQAVLESVSGQRDAAGR